jgi:Domain of unknown function (DUF4291)
MRSTVVPYHQIRATFNDESIIVYQAYNPSIAEAAIRAQTLDVPEFKQDRMTWIKPSFRLDALPIGMGSKSKSGENSCHTPHTDGIRAGAQMVGHERGGCERSHSMGSRTGYGIQAVGMEKYTNWIERGSGQKRVVEGVDFED